jgi:hypothetical protein
MAQRLFLHVGTIKSATTYLQAICDDNAAALAERGLLWLGSAANFSAVADLYGTTRPDEYGAGAMQWPTLVDLIDGHEGDALVSNELLSLRAPKKLDLLFRSLPSAQTQVVITARDFARITVSQWQEHARHRPTGSWAEFIGRVTAADSRHDPEVAWFWRRQDLPRLVEVWAAHVGVENVTVVTVPPRGSTLDSVDSVDTVDDLRERFFGVVGVADAASLTVPPLADNQSLGTHSVELVRRIQQRLDDDERARLHLVLKYIVTRRALADLSRDEPALTLTPDDLAWARMQAAEMGDRLRATGVRVVGDLDDLTPHDAPGAPVAMPSDGELLSAAVDALIGVAAAADDLARTVGGERYGDTVRSIGGRGRAQP